VKLPPFVPNDLRQLLRFVPLRGWDAVDWPPLLGSLQTLSLRFVTRRGVSRIRDEVAEAVPNIALVPHLRGLQKIADVTGELARRETGDDILRLYFSQWLVDEGLFIDLRSSAFGLDRDGVLHFHPNGLWIQLRPDFRAGMLALYRSFYSSDEVAFETALRLMGLLPPGLPDTAGEELKALLHSHFGVAQNAQRFSIDQFKDSFDHLFSFFIKHNYRLHSDFIFVGFYLITLYLTLEEGGQAHDVRQICSDVLL